MEQLQKEILPRLQTNIQKLEEAIERGDTYDYFEGAHVSAIDIWKDTYKFISNHIEGKALDERVEIDNLNFESLDLSGADLYKAHLKDANLCGANLSGANLISANLVGADVSSTNLENADLSFANLSGANLTNAHIVLKNGEIAYYPHVNSEGQKPTIMFKNLSS